MLCGEVPLEPIIRTSILHMKDGRTWLSCGCLFRSSLAHLLATRSRYKFAAFLLSLHKCTGKQSASKWFLCVQKVNQKTGVRIPTSVVLLVEGGLLGYMEYAMRESGDPPSHYLVYVSNMLADLASTVLSVFMHCVNLRKVQALYCMPVMIRAVQRSCIDLRRDNQAWI